MTSKNAELSIATAQPGLVRVFAFCASALLVEHDAVQEQVHDEGEFIIDPPSVYFGGYRSVPSAVVGVVDHEETLIVPRDFTVIQLSAQH